MAVLIFIAVYEELYKVRVADWTAGGTPSNATVGSPPTAAANQTNATATVMATCLMSTDTTSPSVCYYAFAVCGASLVASLAVSILLVGGVSKREVARLTGGGGV